MRTFSIALLIVVVFTLNLLGGIPPVPNPGIIVYGKVSDRSNSQNVVIRAMKWRISNNQQGKSIFLNVGTGIETSVLNGETWYIARIPFVSTNIQGATVDAVPYNTFETMDATTLYDSFVTVNDVNAYAETTPVISYPEVSSGLPILGKALRVDLTIPHNLGKLYNDWVQERWGVVYPFPDQALPNADPDNDGRTNLMEFSETYPLRIISFYYEHSLNGKLLYLVWYSQPGKTYRIETTTSLNGPWVTVQTVPADATKTETTYIFTLTDSGNHYFRVIRPQ